MSKQTMIRYKGYDIEEFMDSRSSPGYDRDSVETSYFISYRVKKDGKILDTFFKQEWAFRFINEQTARGRQILAKMKKLAEKEAKLEKQMEALSHLRGVLADSLEKRL